MFQLDELSTTPPLERRVFCNRTLNLRSIQAVGCDMDYTLVHYNTEVWEARAYEYAQQRLLDRNWPVAGLRFDRELSSIGLVVDVEFGNLVMVNRFGHVRRASHGTKMLSYEECRQVYTTAPVDLDDDRWQFVDTLFSLSETCLFSQLVDLLDKGKLEQGMSYRELYAHVRAAMDATHLEGRLKAEIIADPARYVVLDEELPLTLLDLKQAGKKLMLITNSEWEYTRGMMSYTFDRFLNGGSWRDLFDLVVVSARKPSFFSGDNPVFRVVDESGLLRPHLGPLQLGEVYLGGNARLVERSLSLRGEDILYFGDHIYADVHVSKDLLRWRTALVLRELEEELLQQRAFSDEQDRLREMMAQKGLLEHEFSLIRLRLQRSRAASEGLGEFKLEATSSAPYAASGVLDEHTVQQLRRKMQELRSRLVRLDGEIAPLAERSGQLVSRRWGRLLRCGNDKSHLARQLERHADIYMSRVSNLLAYTPFVYLRAPRGSMPHDDELGTEWVES